MEIDLIGFAIENDAWIRFLHIAGAIISIGAVFASDLFLLILKFKPRFAPVLAKIMPIISMQIWIGLFLLSISGLFLFLPRSGLEEYSIFQWKMFLVLVVFLNGIFLNVWVTPKFEKLSTNWEEKNKKNRYFMIIAGISTVISFVAWWSILILMTVFY